MKTRYHRNGTVTLWNILTQSWETYAADRVPASVLATLSEGERERIAKLASK